MTSGSRREKSENRSGPSDPEVPARPRRRSFTREYKRRILEEADACSEPGEIGALLRREGLYSSHLAQWRQQRREGGLRGLEPKKRGPRARSNSAEAKRLAELERENARLKARLDKAQQIIDFQKKVAEILQIPLNRPESEESD